MQRTVLIYLCNPQPVTWYRAQGTAPRSVFFMNRGTPPGSTGKHSKSLLTELTNEPCLLSRVVVMKNDIMYIKTLKSQINLGSNSRAKADWLCP